MRIGRNRAALDGIQSRGMHSGRHRSAGFLTRLAVFSVLAVCIGATSTAAAVAPSAHFLMRLRQVIPPGTYLVLFQNNAEQRPSGGFLGSFATVSISSWGYSNVKIDTNIYKRDAVFTAQHDIEPPVGLRYVTNGQWAMRDSNWDVDFRDTAQRVSWFYQQEGGEPVDGVIAVNASVLSDLLAITGPILLPDTGMIVTSKTILDQLSIQIEQMYSTDPGRAQINEPKQVLADFLPVIEQRLKDPFKISQVVSLFRQELAEKQLLLYSFHDAVENQILAFGWAGEVVSTTNDYLSITGANVGAVKSSLHVSQSSNLEITSEPKNLHHSLAITRTHQGDGIWPDGPDQRYMRIMLFSSASDVSVSVDGSPVAFRESLESNKVVLGFEVLTDPGRKTNIAVQYNTPLQRGAYQLIFQKQPGTLVEGLRVGMDGDELYDGQVKSDLVIGREKSFPLHPSS